MLDKLKPISGIHSINRVVATIFSPQKFLKPQDVYNKVIPLKGFNKYAKKSLIKPRNFILSMNSVEIKEEDIEGFVFEGYDKSGAIKDVFKLQNTSNSMSVVSFETRKYTRWENFKNSFKSDLYTMSSEVDFYVNAISLNYRDEFNWSDKNTDIKVESIFMKDEESQLLNKKFLSSKNGTIIMISKGTENENNYEDKIEISFNNDVKKIVIDHQYAIRLSELKLFKNIFSNEEFINLFDIAHDENKRALKDILTKECQELIGLS
ncbi:TIGR04255 family protein [Polaribacter porphyrae]|uniref:TIGR04255 family protein n=1 Tax=Polaribacter porphyrae TaxID=1137780 RepID=A0A2S7WRV7_9FLAO|nr:TIGR04255 family protein [Polaribacter porphyrae]PQJ80319.1 TIGR04255 family protein [Polaribacter porphyrae]